MKLIILILLSVLINNLIFAQNINHKDSIIFKDTISFQNIIKFDSIRTKNIEIDSTRKNEKLRESNFQNKFYTGLKSKMSFQYLASLCAPAFWYSPDEPELGKSYEPNDKIIIPSSYNCFENSIFEKPTVYYQINEVVIKENAYGDVLNKKITERDTATVVDLSKIEAFSIYYTHYYKFEKGLGTHQHDNEQVKLILKVKEKEDNPSGKKRYEIIFDRVIAYAHGLFWYDNMFEIDENDTIKLKLPLRILVEEGKHASCPDVNGDGYYNPGYDVNVRTSDAWGIRDVIRTNKLFTSYYQSWMTKVRFLEQIIYPPLPQESPYFDASSNIPKYELKLIPTEDYICNCNKELYHDFKKNYFHKENEPSKDATGIPSWFSSSKDGFKEFVNSYAISSRYDEKFYFTFTFPFFFIKNYEPKIFEGWLVHRLSFYQWPFRWPFYNSYTQNLQYSLLYTPSASRYLDPYIAGGFGISQYSDPNYFFESGIKFRFNTRIYFLEYVGKSILGIRLGIKYSIKKRFDVGNLNMIFEIGLGPF